MSSRQQITPSNDSSRNSSPKIFCLFRQNSKLEPSTRNGSIYVDAVDAVNGEHKKIMFTNPKVIGSGSFGMVFVALLDGEREVAIKKVLQDKRYKNRELQILRDLRHPNIVALIFYFYSVGNFETDSSEMIGTPKSSDSKGTYLNLVQEYVPQALSRVVKHYWHVRQPIPMNYVKLYSFQMIRGLAYVHSKNICHRDIKPQNLLVNPETGVLKICDFGSTKILVPGEPNVSYICSRYYRAPELIFGAMHYTVRIDMWSAGCVIGELLLGRPIFPGDSGVDQLVEIIKVLGTPTSDQVKEMNPQYSKFFFPSIKSFPWDKLITNRSQCEEAFDLLRALLVYSPSQRQSASEALASPFFQQLFTSDSPASNHPTESSSTTDLRPIDPFSEEGVPGDVFSPIHSIELAYLPASFVETIRRSGLTLPPNSSSAPAAPSSDSTDRRSPRDSSS